MYARPSFDRGSNEQDSDFFCRCLRLSPLSPPTPVLARERHRDQKLRGRLRDNRHCGSQVPRREGQRCCGGPVRRRDEGHRSPTEPVSDAEADASARKWRTFVVEIGHLPDLVRQRRYEPVRFRGTVSGEPGSSARTFDGNWPAAARSTSRRPMNWQWRRKRSASGSRRSWNRGSIERCGSGGDERGRRRVPIPLAHSRLQAFNDRSPPG